MSNPRTVIIPAAGLASRLRPMSNSTSKAMISVNGKPIISYIIDQIKDHTDDIKIVYGQSDDIVHYCKKAYPDLPIEFHKQHDPDGPLGAVYEAIRKVNNRFVEFDRELIIWLGDTIVTDYDFSQHRNEVVYSEVHDWERWCLIDKDGKLHDKPQYNPGTKRALVGIYKFAKYFEAINIIRYIRREENPSINCEYQISQLLEKYSQMHQVPTNEWYDCGDFPSLYDSRARLLNKLSREDNVITADPFSGTITKSGDRCINEIAWYRNIPKHVKPFVPAVYNDVYPNEYTMELCPGSTLQDILVYENLKDDTIEYMLSKVFEAKKYCFEMDVLNHDNALYETARHEMWIGKNIDRLVLDKSYAQFHKRDVERLVDMLEMSTFKQGIDKNIASTVIHGDLHFGNILFDFNTGKVKFIDPRGSWGKTATTMGDVEYDYAKLYQSVFCEYMWIINDLETDYELKDKLIKIMDNLVGNPNQARRYKILSAVMMATCIPFHNDDPKRQQRLWDTSQEAFKEIA